MAGARYEFSADLWRWAARTEEWVFLRLPEAESAEIAAVPRLRAGFGSVKVRASIGATSWRTSIFPESADGAYVLPVKMSVRRAEGIGVGDTVRVAVETLDV